MIIVSEEQSQLSGWGHYAVPKALKIKKVPRPFMAGETVNISVVRENGGTELEMSDGTILSYNEQNGLLPALEGVTVWSVPAEGTVIPSGLDYVEIHASYITREGKYINAVPAKVPVATPSYMRCIVPVEPLIDEGQYLHTQASWFDSNNEVHGHKIRGYNTAFFHGAAFLAIYWTDSNGEVIRVTRVESGNPLYQRPFAESYSSVSPWDPTIIVGDRSTSATFTRYRSVDDEGEEITLENGNNKIVFKHTILNITLTCETYVQVNPIISWGFFNLPTSYSGSQSVTLSIEKESKVKFKSGKVMIGKYADSGYFYLPIWFRYKVVGGWWEYRAEQTITLADERTGNLWQYSLRTMRDGSDLYKIVNKSYTCDGGRVTWFNTPSS